VSDASSWFPGMIAVLAVAGSFVFSASLLRRLMLGIVSLSRPALLVLPEPTGPIWPQQSGSGPASLATRRSLLQRLSG